MFSCSLSKNVVTSSFCISLPRELVSDDSVLGDGIFAQCKIIEDGTSKEFIQTHKIEDRGLPVKFEFLEICIGKKYDICINVYVNATLSYQGQKNDFIFSNKEQELIIELKTYEEGDSGDTGEGGGDSGTEGTGGGTSERVIPTDFVFVQGSTIKAAGDEYNQINDTNGNQYFFIKDREIVINDYYICDHEVTQKEYSDVMGARTGDKKPSETYGLGDDYPMYYVTWIEAVAYCNKRSANEGLEPCYYAIVGNTNNYNIDEWGDLPSSSSDDSYQTWEKVKCDFTKNGYRLPTEAEWEYAARGGSTMSTFKYAGSDALTNVGWYSENSNSKVHQIKQKDANGLSLYDMSGNVCEWCYDYNPKQSKITTSTISPNETYNSLGRVIRGGSFLTLTEDINDCNVAGRDYTQVHYATEPTVGFRLVLSQ